VTDLFAPFRQAAGDREAAARAFKAAGGKVVGYVGPTVPTELIAATGAFPLRLAGEAAATPLADRYMEALFDPVVRAVFETALAGRYDFVDAIVLARTSDSAQRLYYYLCEVRRLGEAQVPEPLLYDLLHTPWYSSAEYNLARIGELKANLERVAGRMISDAALADAIATSNRRRAGLEAFANLRRSRPARVSGPDAQAVFAASQTMPAEAFDAALSGLLTGANGAHAGPRIVLAGSGQVTPRLHRLIESHGGVVVGDFHEFGEPLAAGRVAEGGAPLRALTAHYHRAVASSRTFPQSAAPLVEFAKAAGADGVLFYFLREEEALTWEYPAQRRALEAAGIRVLCLEDMTQQPDEAAIGPGIATFLDGLAAKVAS